MIYLALYVVGFVLTYILLKHFVVDEADEYDDFKFNHIVASILWPLFGFGYVYMIIYDFIQDRRR